MNESAQAMWEAFQASGLPAAASAQGGSATAWAFGDGPEIADRLLALVLSGRKRATTGSLVAYEAEGEAIPRPGDFSVVLDGAGHAACIVRTTWVEQTAFSNVGPGFARDEGEGDLSFEYWRTGHQAYFTRELASYGREASEDMPVVCERFEVVFPAEASMPVDPPLSARPEVVERLRELEEQLWRPETRYSWVFMETVLAADFVEVGSSGRVYDRRETIEAVPQHPEVELPLPEFAVRSLSQSAAIVTYRSVQRLPDGTTRRASRASVWIAAGDKWAIAYHQGTLEP